MVPSPKVATYDLKPEMSAVEITDQLVEYIDAKNQTLYALTMQTLTWWDIQVYLKQL